jgi:cytochrome c-type biogenesis protein CcmE
MTDILVKYEGSLPDLFREGHSVVVEGFIRPFTAEIRAKDDGNTYSKSHKMSEKARSLECYFKATEVLAKHDEKYMPAEVASALEKNKKLLMQEQQQAAEAEGATGGVSSEGTATAAA